MIQANNSHVTDSSIVIDQRRSPYHAIICFTEFMLLYRSAAIVLLASFDLAGQELVVSNIHVEKMPGQNPVPVIATVNGKPTSNLT